MDADLPKGALMSFLSTSSPSLRKAAVACATSGAAATVRGRGSHCSDEDCTRFGFQLHVVTIHSLLWKDTGTLETARLERVPHVKPSF